MSFQKRNEIDGEFGLASPIRRSTNSVEQGVSTRRKTVELKNKTLKNEAQKNEKESDVGGNNEIKFNAENAKEPTKKFGDARRRQMDVIS